MEFICIPKAENFYSNQYRSWFAITVSRNRWAWNEGLVTEISHILDNHLATKKTRKISLSLSLKIYFCPSSAYNIYFFHYEIKIDCKVLKDFLSFCQHWSDHSKYVTSITLVLKVSSSLFTFLPMLLSRVSVVVTRKI